jgi:hypothetical protein
MEGDGGGMEKWWQGPIFIRRAILEGRFDE